MGCIKRIIIFGGSGFIGKYIVQNLANCGHVIKIFTRNLEQAMEAKTCGNVGQIEIISGNVSDDKLVEKHIAGCDVVINLIGILHETKKIKFQDVHVKYAEKIAQIATKYKVETMILFSAMGVNQNNKSQYAKSKLEGEEAVKKAFPNVVIARPGLVFGPEDNFFNKFAKLATIFPCLPLIGGGYTKFQPIYVDDLARLVQYIIENNETKKLYVVGGPKMYTFKSLLKLILNITGRKCLLINIPFSIANFLGFILEFKIVSLILKPITGTTDPLLTRDQVKLLQYNKISKSYDLKNAKINPVPLENILSKYLSVYKKL